MKTSANNTDSFEDNGSEESFVVLEEAARAAQTQSVSDFMSVAGSGRVPSHRQKSVCRRVRDADNPAELTAVLLEHWRPEPEDVDPPASGDVPWQQGHVVNVDIEDVLFTLEEDLKKLLSLIVYKRTGFAAKTAAIDVFTWMCTVEEIMNNPIFSKQDVCKWILGLLEQTDGKAESSALRGVRNLARESVYQALLVGQNGFGKVLDYIKEDAAPVKHADIYVFEIYHNLMTSERAAVNQVALADRLVKRLCDERLSLEARIEGMHCLETFIDRSEIRNSLLDMLLERGCILTWLQLGREGGLAATLDVVFTILSNLPEDRVTALLNDVVNSNDTMVNLHQSLISGVSPMEAQILMLLLKTAADLPRDVYEDYLDVLWPKFQAVMDDGSEDSQQCVLDILHALAVEEGLGKKNRSLPLPDSGLSFIRTLVNSLNNQTFDILYFIWTSYDDLLPILTEVKVIAAIFSTWMTTYWMMTCDLDKVHAFLKEALQEMTDPQMYFDDCLLDFLRDAVTAENADVCHHSLRIGLDLIVTIKDKSNGLPSWILDDGLVSFMTTIMSNAEHLSKIEDPLNLLDILREILLMFSHASSPDAHDIACSILFLDALNAAHVFGIETMAGFLTSIKLHGFGYNFVPESAVHRIWGAADNLKLEGWRVLHLLLDGWSCEEDSCFLNTLLSLFPIFLLADMNQHVGRHSVLCAFAGVLGRLSLEETTDATKRLLISSLTVCSDNFRAETADVVRKSGNQAAENLWNLIMNTCDDQTIQLGRQPLLALLKAVSVPMMTDDASEQVASLLQENAELRQDIHQTKETIHGLEQELTACKNERDFFFTEVHERRVGEGSGANANDVVQQLRREVAAQECEIKKLTEQCERLTAEVANRSNAYDDIIQVVDNQHNTISTLQTLLSQEGFEIELDI